MGRRAFAFSRVEHMSNEKREHVCARCPKVLGASCCVAREGERLVSLTLSDVARIREHVRRPAQSFTTTEVLEVEEAWAYEERRPLWRGYFLQSAQRLTLKLKGRACVFLDERTGCTLPEDVRPTGCRLYPFDQWPNGEWGVQVGRYGSLEGARAATDACLAVEEADDLDALFELFGTTREQVEALGEKLRREVRAHGRGAGRLGAS